jgi:electron transfer flavoprotein alpha/beta subunit
MKILVPIKRVIDANIKVRVKSDQSGVELNNVKMAMNPFCEIAVEAALRLREAGEAEEVIVVCAGPANGKETLRTALAMGADRAIHIESEDSPEPLAVAKLLKAVVEREELTAAALDVDITPRLTVLKVEAPASRSAGVRVHDAAELVDKLKNEAKVI